MVQLNYRGISYETQEYSLVTFPSIVRAKFRGNTYNVAQNIVMTTIQPSPELFKYRGILYKKNFANVKIKTEINSEEKSLQN